MMVMKHWESLKKPVQQSLLSKKGDFVIASFTHGCGHCEACLAGYDGVCLNHKQNFSANAQAEYMRFPHGQWALVKVSGKLEDYTEDMIASLLTLADVMATGYHAARTANVQPGDTALVIGDGAVGLCGVISAKLRGAKQIILMSHYEDRAALGKDFGATEIVSERDVVAIEHVMQLTNNVGADAVLECVGAVKQLPVHVLVQKSDALAYHMDQVWILLKPFIVMYNLPADLHQLLRMTNKNY